MIHAFFARLFSAASVWLCALAALGALGCSSDSASKLVHARDCGELTTCGYLCIDTQTDPSNCGACLAACADDQSCVAGQCVTADSSVTCAEPTPKACHGTCTSLLTDAANCGACGKQCAGSSVCSSGNCGASCDGETPDRCDSQCVSLRNDPAHCGACDNACASGQTCVDGVCADACPAPRTACGSSCVDTSSSPHYCGDCGTSCATGEACIAGKCQANCADAKLTNCGGECVDLSTDPGYCGRCTGSVCVSGAFCSDGVCGASCAGSAPDACDGRCVSLSTDPKNCGACGTSCGDSGVCSQGTCLFACDGPSTPVVDERSDPAHCGDCATKCAAGEVCSKGKCSLSCAAGLEECSAACVDLKSDPNNCGACTAACSLGQACTAGVCQDLGLPRSCADLLARDPSAKSGVYALDPDGTGYGQPKFNAYCDMTNDGGGWTLILKADGTKSTFAFDATTWEDATPLNAASADLTKDEAKLDSYSRLPLGDLRIVTESAALVVPVAQMSLFQSIHQQISGPRNTQLTTVGRPGWLSLFPGQSLVGTGCNLEGIDAEAVDQNDGSMRVGVRIGLLSGVAPNCDWPDGYLGVGGKIGAANCASGPGPSVGGISGCGTGASFSAFAYVFGRELPRSCAEVKTRTPAAVDGEYVIDPDGAGPLPAFSAYCDMSFDGGGWTLFFVQPQAGGSIEGTPVPGGNQYLRIEVVKALATLGSQVHLRTAGMVDTRSITSIANAYPIVNLRRGSLLNLNANMHQAGDPVTGWTGPYAQTDEHLWQGCGEDELDGTYPTLYHACNNVDGVHVNINDAGWAYLEDEDFEAYVR